jgi:hypothetical protein
MRRDRLGRMGLSGLRFAAQDSIGFPDVAPPRPLPNPLGVARRIAREEAARTEALVRQRRISTRGFNDIYDAERHARWTYRMSQELGPRVAHKLSSIYEIKGLVYDRQPLRSSRMDLHNNAIGIREYLNNRPIPNISTRDLIYIEENFPRPGTHTYKYGHGGE